MSTEAEVAAAAETTTEATDAAGAETSSSADAAAQGDEKKDAAAQGDEKKDAAAETPPAESTKFSIVSTRPDLAHAGKPVAPGTVLFDGCYGPTYSLEGLLGAVENHLVQCRAGATAAEVLVYGRRDTSTRFGDFTADGWVAKGELAEGFTLDAVARYFRDGKAAAKAPEPAEPPAE